MRDAALVTRLRQLVEWFARTPRLLRVTAALGWAATIWWLSARPSGGGESSPLYGFVWNGGHVAAWFVLATLLESALRESVAVPRVRAGVAVAIGAAWGIVDELHQSTVSGRDASAWDVVSDTCGAALAACVLLWLGGRLHGRWIAVAIGASLLAVTASTFL